MVIIKQNGREYYLNHIYKQFVLDIIIPHYIKRHWDMVIIVEGEVGAGKSTIAIQSGFYLDPTLNVDRICFTLPQMEEAIDKGKRGQVIIYDEAVSSLLSIEVFKRESTALVKKITQCRKKGLIIFLLIPSIFMLQKYFAIFRSKFDIRVLSRGGERGNFAVYGRRAKQQLIERANGTFRYLVKPSLPIMSFHKDCPIDIGEGSEYDKKKDSAMAYRDEADKINVLPGVLYAFHKEFNLGRIKVDELMKKYNIPIKGKQVEGKWNAWKQKQKS
jgi:predicted ABC-type ATPase